MNGKQYTVDWIFAKVGDDGLCQPDLIENSLYMKMQKERKKEVKAYYEEEKRQAEAKQERIL